MLTFHVITLFPDLITLYCSSSILGRGQTGKWFSVRTYNPRDFCTDKYRKVDDTPYGGGAGMVMKVEPIFAALESIQRKDGSPVILMTPRGHKLTQPEAQNLAFEEDITIVCGHYEGIDERVRSIVTDEISIGDFVLTGGELPALAVIDAVGRLIPGVLGQSASLSDESFTLGLLEAPQYTKPAKFHDMGVPEILRSGNHKAVERWRRAESLKLTWERRPDLLESATLDDTDRALLKQLKNGSKED